KKQRVWLHDHHLFDERRMQETHPFGGFHVKMWGAITQDGFLAHRFFDGGLNTAAYLEILTKDCIPAGKRKFGSNTEWTFQQDNAGPHKPDEVRLTVEGKN